MSTTVPLYHHSRPLKSVVYGRVEASPEHADKYSKDAYSWLEKEVRFFPIFLSVGTTDEDIRMTGYQNQWRRILSEGRDGKLYRKKGEFPNDVLFSFENINGVFMDYDYWHLVLNASHRNYHLTNYENRLIFKPSWSKSRWLSKVKQNPHSVQLVTSKLYLPNANMIWVRNKQTERLIKSMGFKNTRVRRLLL